MDGLGMDRVLVLTKNILTERELQNKLQLLNYEVYCSTKLFNECIEQKYNLDLFKLFQYVILSESISESELTKLTTFFKPLSLSIIRKVGTKVTEIDQHYLEIGLLNAIISTKDSLDELRECLSSLGALVEQSDEHIKERTEIQLSRSVTSLQPHLFQNSKNDRSDVPLYLEVLQRLSHTEAKIMAILINAGNQIVSREEICRELWREDANKSHLASLSSTISRIKTKFDKTPLKGSAIHTFWGKGYCIDKELFRKLESDEILKRSILV